MKASALLGVGLLLLAAFSSVQVMLEGQDAVMLPYRAPAHRRELAWQAPAMGPYPLFVLPVTEPDVFVRLHGWCPHVLAS